MDPKLKRVFSSLLIFVLLFSSFIKPPVLKAAEGDTLWAASSTTASDEHDFNAVTTDLSGNVVAAGYIYARGSYGFGNGVTVSGNSFNDNAAIVKYDSTGVAQWAASTVDGGGRSGFRGVSTDDGGNVYVVGFINTTGIFDFGNSVTVAGGNAGNNAFIIKYNSAGVAQWAASATTAPDQSHYEYVSTDSLGNSYAVGYIFGNSQFNFGNGVTVTGARAAGTNAVIVKYNSDGLAQWAKSTAVAPNGSLFESVNVDASGNIYAVGSITANGQYDFGNGVTVAGGYASSSNAVIVKYNSSGLAQWAKSTSTGPNASYLHGVSSDSLGNIFTAGYITGAGTYNFGDGVTVAGINAGSNVLIIKYDSGGVSQWARSVSTGPGVSYFYGISTDSSGRSYAAGEINGTGTYGFGGGITAVGGYSTNNAIVVGYGSDGTAAWAASTATAPNKSVFEDISVDSSGGIYAAGYIYTNAEFSFGSAVTVTGANAFTNTVVVKYEGVPPAAVVVEEAAAEEVFEDVVQIPLMSEDVVGEIVAEPVRDSDTKGQGVFTIIEPGTFGFDAYLSSKSPLPSSLVSAPNVFTNTILGGGINGILGVKSLTGTYWQVGKLQEMWYKSYPPEGHESAVIIPELQENPSIIAFRYTDSDLIPLGRPEGRYNPKNFRLAHSLDGRTWKIMPSSVVDTVNKTVAAVDSLGGYYMIVGK